MAVDKFIQIQMIQNDIPDKTELARQTGIDYQRLNRRIKQPSTMTLSELSALSSVLNFSEDTVLDFLKETGALWGVGTAKKQKR